MMEVDLEEEIMEINKWQKPTSDFCGMTDILADFILQDKTHSTYDIKLYNLSTPSKVVIHSYREVGTSLSVCCEVVFKDGYRKLGNIVL